MRIHDADEIRDAVRERYAAAARLATERTTPDQAASCCGGGASACCSPEALDPFGGAQYGEAERQQVPEDALLASLGCGNPTLLADLRPR